VATFILLRHSLRRARTLVLGIALVLSGFQLVLTAVAASLQRTNAFGALATMIPEFFRQFIGPSTLAMLSFSGIVCAGYFHPIVIASILALVVALATGLSRTGSYSFVYAGELVGIALMFAGFAFVGKQPRRAPRPQPSTQSRVRYSQKARPA